MSTERRCEFPTVFCRAKYRFDFHLLSKNGQTGWNFWVWVGVWAHGLVILVLASPWAELLQMKWLRFSDFQGKGFEVHFGFSGNVFSLLNT